MQPPQRHSLHPQVRTDSSLHQASKARSAGSAGSGQMDSTGQQPDSNRRPAQSDQRPSAPQPPATAPGQMLYAEQPADAGTIPPEPFGRAFHKRPVPSVRTAPKEHKRPPKKSPKRSS